MTSGNHFGNSPWMWELSNQCSRPTIVYRSFMGHWALGMKSQLFSFWRTAYNPRMTMPKLLSIASMDEFFLPDDTHYFWEELTEPKYMTWVANHTFHCAQQTSLINQMLHAVDQLIPLFTVCMRTQGMVWQDRVSAETPTSCLFSWLSHQ